MAEAELGNRSSIRLSYGTNGKICALGFLRMLASVQCIALGVYIRRGDVVLVGRELAYTVEISDPAGTNEEA